MKLEHLLSPERIRGVEYLDDPATPDDVRHQAMADVARSNALFGGHAAVAAAVQVLIPGLPRVLTVLDVGTGHAEIAARVRRDLAAAGKAATIVGVDIAESVARAGTRFLDSAVAGSALTLPLRDASVDLVICSQLLHHFAAPEARAVLAELDRVSRGWIVVADLRRSRAAAAGFWLASLALGFHPVTRHDGVVSVLRGFAEPELASLVRESTGARPRMRRGLFWRISATWRASNA
ncbi:MAG: methyltransferase domain-containing protein [Gemmatimonadota bacterium]